MQESFLEQKVFLNTELKPYNSLTREEKHILLDAALDMNMEYTYSHGNSWYSKDSVCVEFYNDTIYRTKPKEYKKLNVPWEYIDDYWKYAVMDGCGSVLLYATKPEWIVDDNIWSYDHHYRDADILKLDTTGIVAEHSLTQRP